MNILNMYFLSTSCVLLLDIEDAIKNLWGVEATFLTDIELYKDWLEINVPFEWLEQSKKGHSFPIGLYIFM